MAAPKAKDPLDALQLLINDVLVQTGKALRASRRDSQGNLVQPPGTMQSKLPDTIQAFHSALDELESDIVRAKSVLLRDLNQLQSNKTDAGGQPLQPPQPIESQSKSPINIDLESSPQAAPAPPTPKKQAAPVPDMDVNMSNGATTEKGPAVKKEEESAKAEPQPPTGTTKPETAAVKTEAEQEASAAAPAADDPSDLLDSNFTDMEFSLAPTAEDTNGANQNDSSSMPTFDLTSFAPNDSNDNNVISLDALESATQQPQSTQAEAPAATAATTTTATADTKTEEEKKKETNAKFEEIFGNDGSQADGMDFDFSLDGGGMGDDTFDDLMNDRDGTFEMMNNEDFDAAFFGLDGSNTES